tara:strand:- start:7980 stop:8570 length:591 start_codon:yes stop_codon:yes gene_type:complete
MAYIGAQPQNVKQNIGLYTPSDILRLTKDGHWGGSLDLIQSQSVSGAATCNFTNIQGAKYDVHLLQLDDIDTASTFYTELRLSNDGGSSFETSSYHRSIQYGGTNSGFGVNNSTSADRFTILGHSRGISHYVYLYSLNNSSQYSYITHQSAPANIYMYFGSGAYAVAEKIDAIQLLNSAGSNFSRGTATLFGIKDI